MNLFYVPLDSTPTGEQLMSHTFDGCLQTMMMGFQSPKDGWSWRNIMDSPYHWYDARLAGGEVKVCRWQWTSSNLLIPMIIFRPEWCRQQSYTQATGTFLWTAVMPTSWWNGVSGLTTIWTWHHRAPVPLPLSTPLIVRHPAITEARASQYRQASVLYMPLANAAFVLAMSTQSIT